jgi:Argonaute linker 2 domain
MPGMSVFVSRPRLSDRFCPSLQSIRNGLKVFEYDSSEYLRSFGMQVNTGGGPLAVPARILEPPNLKYGAGSKQQNIVRISFLPP